MSKIKVFEAFAGYGSQSIALRNIGVDYEVVGISEIDKYAIQAYESIHGKVNNFGDISKIDVTDIPSHDLFTYSFPCQDISAAGKTRGIIRGQTRSGLLYECEKIIEHCRPKYLLLENVKNLVSKKFEMQFIKWLKYLNTLGYTNYWKVLNAKDYGVPQNRERVFVVSILGEHKPYKFPKAIKLTTHVKDILEDEVDEKYYLSQKWQDTFTALTKPRLNTKLQPFQDINNKLKNQRVNTIAVVGNIPIKFHQNARIIDSYGISPTLLTSQATKIVESDRIRYITPRESFRLMGLTDTDIDKIQQLDISDNQQYKLAGNSIVVNVLEAIFQSLFENK